MSRPRHQCALPVAAGLAGLTLGGCGSGGGGLPAAAEPADSPQLSARPAGRVFEVGHDPEGIVADPVTGKVAVGLHKPDQLAILKARDGRIVRRVSLPASPRHLALARPGGPVLVPAETADRLVSVELGSGRSTTTRVGRHPHDVAFAAGKAFVSDEFGDTVSVVRGGRVSATLPAPVQPGGIAALGRSIVLVAVRQRVVETYEARSLHRSAPVPAGVGPTHVVAGDGRAYVADTEGNAILVYRLRQGRPLQVGRVAAPGAPYGLALDRRRKRLWVTLTASNRAVELSLDGRRPSRIASFPTVRQPNSIAVDSSSGDAFVSGRADGVVERIPGAAGR